MVLWLGHSSLGNCGVRRYTAQVSEEETEAQAGSPRSAISLCRAVSLTWVLWVAWDELEGVGLEAPAARPVHAHLRQGGVSAVEMRRCLVLRKEEVAGTCKLLVL